MKGQHFIGLSGGADSLAVALLAEERMDAGKFAPNRPPLFFACDVDHEAPQTIDYLGYLETALGVPIRILKADFSHMFEARRANIRADWAVERRQRNHTEECKDRRDGMAIRKWREACDCPETVWPALSQELIDRACAALHPTGNVFLDMCLLHGLFPSVMRRFCTDELKVQPIEAMVRPYLAERIPVISWIGERAEESKTRAAKPVLQRWRSPSGVPRLFYRPIHSWTKRQCFDLAKRHGIKPNPLYLMGMGRVGCLPCIMAKKRELRQIAIRFPEAWEKLQRWEETVALVSRRAATLGQDVTTFFAADKTPGINHDRSHALAVKDWAMRTRGDGRNYDLLMDLENDRLDRDGGRCDSEYGLCE